MTELLNEMERALTDLMLSGAAAAESGTFRCLARECGETGLHTGGELMAQVAHELERRAHTMEKENLPLTELVCRAMRYITLCRLKLSETQIRERWERHTGGNT